MNSESLKEKKQEEEFERNVRHIARFIFQQSRFVIDKFTDSEIVYLNDLFKKEIKIRKRIRR